VMDSDLFNAPEGTVGTSIASPASSPQYAVVGGTVGHYSNDIAWLRLKEAEGNTLPSGLTIDQYTGRITGTPKEASAAGSVIVEAYDRYDSSNVCEFTVAYGAIDYSNPVTEMTLDKTELSFPAGGSGSVTATLLPANASNTDVIWSRSNSRLSLEESADENTRTVTLSASDSASSIGEYTLTAVSKSGGWTKTCKVYVTEKKPEAVFDDEDTPKLTGLDTNREYLINDTVSTSNGYGVINVSPEWYGQTIRIVKKNASSDKLNSPAQELLIDVGIPESLALSIEAPVKGATPVTTIATGTKYCTLESLSWSPSDTVFAEGKVYTATIVLKAKGELTFPDTFTATLNARTLPASELTFTNGKKTLTIVHTFPETEAVVHVTGVQISPSEIIIPEGADHAAYTVTVLPKNADNKEVTADTADHGIAVIQSVSYGWIKPVAVGKTTLTVTSKDGGKSGTVDVYVYYRKPEAIQNNDMLEGLVPNAVYKITPKEGEAGTVTASSSGTVPMEDAWYETVLSIVRTHETYEKCNSEEQKLTTSKKTDIPAQGFYAELKDGTEYTYTASAIRPEVLVYNNGELLRSGIDYTLKYSGNVNVKRNKGAIVEGAKVTITGKGNLSGSKTLRFKILPKELGNEAVYAEGINVGKVTVLKKSTAAPVITYGTYRLKSGDYKLKEPKKKYTIDTYMELSGKGNFTGDIKVLVNVVEAKKELHKIAVSADKKTIRFDPLKDETAMKAELVSHLKVYDSKDKSKTPIDADKYEIIYPANVTDAGLKTLTVVAKAEGVCTGSASVKLTVKPLAVKPSAENGMIADNAAADVKTYADFVFSPKGVSVSDVLEVKYIAPDSSETVLEEGRDYTITYKNNKAASTETKKATYTVKFTGNYKGTPALQNSKKPKVDSYEFTISPAPISKEGNLPADNVSVIPVDVAYGKKANLYTSVPYVIVDGAALSSKNNYTVTCYKDAERTEESRITKNNKLSIPDGDKEATVYVTVKGKGNYTGTIYSQYTVKKTEDTVFDMSKAKVTIYKKGYAPGNKKNKKLTAVSYTGRPIVIDDPENVGAVVVEYKLDGKKFSTLTEGTDYSLTYLNNVNQGKATILVKGLSNAGRTFIGTKKTGFTINKKKV
nr:Ig-like domain-containing protein [Lachnospiraceae bacterium]